MSREIVIRQETPADKDAVRNVHQLAFGRPDESGLVESISQSNSYIPELSFVALIDNQVVGHVLFSIVHIDTEPDVKPVLALAPLAVHPQYQRIGVGDRLTRHGIAEAKSRGWDAVIVLGQPSYYPRFGFQPSHEYGIESPFPLNDPSAFMVMELKEDALENCCGTVVYPNFFMELT